MIHAKRVGAGLLVLVAFATFPLWIVPALIYGMGYTLLDTTPAGWCYH